LGLLTVNALAAADSVLIPMQCEFYALEGISELLATLTRIQRALNPALEVEAFSSPWWTSARTSPSR